MSKKLRRVGMCAVIALSLHATGALAATYYLGTNGNNNNSCATAQSSSTPKASFSSAWSCLAAGDTLVVSSGTYTSASPPSGKAGAAGQPIVVQASTDGGAVLSGGLVLVNNSYLEFIGFKVQSSGTALDSHSAGSGKVTHHVTFRRMGFNTTTTVEYGGISLSDGTHHMLFEDFWAWGGGRYTLMCYGGPGGDPANTTCDSNTFRRGVIRQGPGDSAGGNPEAALALYYASNNVVENVIALDGHQDSDSSNAAFYLTAHSPPPGVTNNKYYGVVALNNKGYSWYVDADNGAQSGGNAIYNSVLWGSYGGIALYNGGGSCSGTVIDHVTLGLTSQNEGIANFCSSTSITSSIVTQAKSTAMKSSGSMATVSNNLVFGNGGTYSGVTSSASLTSDPQLKYLLRTEAGTPCKGAGAGGSDCGATIDKRYQDGKLTTTNLWPWPNEARIRKDMCTDAGVSTGFCSKASLTDYVWGYLGNGSPISSAPLPNPPTDISVK